MEDPAERSDGDPLIMFFIHLLDNFCSLNVELERAPSSPAGRTTLDFDASWRSETGPDALYSTSTHSLFTSICQKLQESEWLAALLQ